MTDRDKKIEQIVTDLFNANNIRHDFNVLDGVVYVFVEWGDWKHDHRFLINLMTGNDFFFTRKQTTEQDDSDSYSAEHQYVYYGDMKDKMKWMKPE